MRNYIIIMVLSVLVSGCSDVLDIFLSVPEKINKAFPPSVEVRFKEEALREFYRADTAALESFTKQFAAKLNLRALTCSEGLSIGRFDTVQAIQKLRVSHDCLNAQDSRLLEYLGIMHVAARVSQPPLRPMVPLGKASRVLTTGGPEVYSLEDASEAGIVILRGTRGEQVAIEIPSGKKIVSLPTSQNVNRVYVSPNGRVAVYTYSGGRGIEFFDVETGREIWASEDIVNVLEWVPSLDAMLVKTNKPSGLLLVDFKTGSIRPHPLDLKNQTWALIVSNNPARLLVGSQGGCSLIEYVRTPDGFDVSMLAEHRFGAGAGVTSFRPTLMRGGNSVVFISMRNIAELNLESGKQTLWETEKFLVNRYAKLSETALLVDSYKHNSASTTPWVFDLEASTLAPVKSENDEQGIIYGFSGRVGYMRRGLGKIWIGDQVSAGAPQTLDKLVSAFNLERQIALLEAGKFPSGSVPTRANRQGEALERTVTDGYRADKAARYPDYASDPKKYGDAQLHVVGVYEGPVHFGRVMPDPSASRINLRVHSKGKPIVLVLCNYEAVLWDIKPDPGVEINEIILSSYNGSRVSGVDEKKVRILRQNLGCSYKTSVPQELKARFGLDVASFQGLYRGTEFSVGP